MKQKLQFFIITFIFASLAHANEVSLNISPLRGNGLIEGTQRFNFFVSEIKTETRTEPLHQSERPFGELGDTLKINIQTQDGSFSELDIPEAVNQRILNYLESGSSQSYCDCHCFGALVADQPYPHKIMPDGTPYYTAPGTKRTRLHSDAQLKAGDVILLGEALDEKNFKTNHTAIYLGNGLYLSKLGHGAGLVVTNLSEIMRAYTADLVFLVESEKTMDITSEETIESESSSTLQ